MQGDWGDYAHPRAGCLPILLLGLSVGILGCATVKNWEAMQKVEQYDAHYVPAEAGWCSGQPIPEQDRWILDCKYGYMSCEKETE